MFHLPASLDYSTLRKAFNSHNYTRLFRRVPRLLQAACRKGLRSLSYT